MSVLVKSVYRWFKPIWEQHWNSVINWKPSSSQTALITSWWFILYSSSFCTSHLVIHMLHYLWFVLIVPTPLCLYSFFPLLRAPHPAHAFLSRPSNLFLLFQDKCYVRGLCFPPSPSQSIYDVPAVRAISQDCGVHCRSKPGWTVVPSVHHKHLRLF